MSLINIFGKIFTARFYARNTGFFFLLFYLLFGVVQGGQLISYHYGLLLGIVSNTGFLLLALGIWILYNLKCAWYVLGTIGEKEYSFLYQTIGSMSINRQRRNWLLIHISIYAPVFIYVSTAFMVACLNGFYPVAVILIVFNVLMCCAPVWLYSYLVQRPGTSFFYHRWRQWMNRHLHKPLPLFYLYELAANRTRSLLVLKGLSCITLLTTFTLMGEGYDIRALLTGLLISCLLHTVVVFEHRHFEDQQLAFMRNLPVPLWKRYGATAVTYAGILLPEFVLMIIRTLSYSSWHWALLLAFSLSVLLACRSLLYFPRLDQDKYLRWVFLLFCVLLFMILGHVYGWAVLLLQCFAYPLFAIRYYRYEPDYEQVQ
jgi:hypothetical protein